MKLNYFKLGSNMNKEENGFSGTGGGWDLYKMFYKNYYEFFININTKTGEAEILEKDTGYAPQLLAALTRTLEEGIND